MSFRELGISFIGGFPLSEVSAIHCTVSTCRDENNSLSFDIYRSMSDQGYTVRTN